MCLEQLGSKGLGSSPEEEDAVSGGFGERVVVRERESNPSPQISI